MMKLCSYKFDIAAAICVVNESKDKVTQGNMHIGLYGIGIGTYSQVYDENKTRVNIYLQR